MELMNWRLSEDTLRKHFSNYGEVEEALILSEEDRGDGRGFGYVTFKDPAGPINALNRKHFIHGAKVRFFFFFLVLSALVVFMLLSWFWFLFLLLLVNFFFFLSFVSFFFFLGEKSFVLLSVYICYSHQILRVDVKPALWIGNVTNLHKNRFLLEVFQIIWQSWNW